MTLKYENQKLKQGYGRVVGCDEVGRGCLAGPVVAAAVILDFSKRPKWFSEINDSKKLSPEKREYLSEKIKEQSLWSIGEVSSDIVDEINIHNASLLAMKKAVEGLFASIPEFFTHQDIMSRKKYPGSRTQKIVSNPISGSRLSDALGRYGVVFLYVDGKFTIPNIKIRQQAVVGGDNKVLSIAAASIIAKVYRDELMAKLHQSFPIYNFARHKGYATKYHRKVIIEHGLSPLHRLTFCQSLTS